jgi:hypothetical protein
MTIQTPDDGINISSAEIATLIDEALGTEEQAPGLIAGAVLDRVQGVPHIVLAVACLCLLLEGNVELAARCRRMQEENERRTAHVRKGLTMPLAPNESA